MAGLLSQNLHGHQANHEKPTSFRRQSASPRSANLVGAYVEKPAMPTKPDMDATITARPERLQQAVHAWPL